MNLRFHMTIGLPASGKSAYAKQLAEKNNLTYLSSDDLRQELWGDVNDQQNPQAIFDELYKRAKKSLVEGKSVVIDATNINDNRRRIAIEEFRRFSSKADIPLSFIAHYMNTNVNICIRRDEKRERKVGKRVIENMYKGLTIPTYAEGWDEINIINVELYEHQAWWNHFETMRRKDIESIITSDVGYKTLFTDNLILSDIFASIYELSQDNHHHTYNVGRHTYYLWKDVLHNYVGKTEKDKLQMLWTALFHDTGKAFCKEFDEDKRLARFIGHENVSSQLACELLMHLGYDKDFVISVCELVQNHMKLLSIGDSEKGRNKLYNFLGGDSFQKLEIFREYDMRAK
jgi:predicted kinase